MVLAGYRVGEALIVTQIQVGLGAIFGHVDLTVLIRAHRARVDVDVRVELLQRHPIPMAFEQAPDRCGGQPLAKRGDDAARHEDVLDGAILTRRSLIH